MLRTCFGDLWQSDAMSGPKLPDPANPDQEGQTILFAFLLFPAISLAMATT